MRLPPLTSACVSPRLLERYRVESLEEISGRLRPMLAILGEAGQHERIQVLWNRESRFSRTVAPAAYAHAPAAASSAVSAVNTSCPVRSQ